MDIYIARGEERKGPYSEDSIRQFLADGQLDGSELAWHEGLDAWVNLKEVMKGEDAPAETEADTLGTPEEAVEMESTDQMDKTALFDLSDPNQKIIEEAIREALEKPEGELTKADLDKVTELAFRGDQLTDVTALKDLTQLTVLNLRNNQLTDVTALKHLTQLAWLSLYGNPDLTKTQIAELEKSLPNLNTFQNIKIMHNATK